MVPEIDIYIDPECPYCRRLKSFLLRKRVPFHEHDVNRDMSARQLLESVDAQGVPVICVNNQIIMGFDEDRLNKLLPDPAVVAPTRAAPGFAKTQVAPTDRLLVDD